MSYSLQKTNDDNHNVKLEIELIKTEFNYVKINRRKAYLVMKERGTRFKRISEDKNHIQLLKQTVGVDKNENFIVYADYLLKHYKNSAHIEIYNDEISNQLLLSFFIPPIGSIHIEHETDKLIEKTQHEYMIRLAKIFGYEIFSS
jgi:hypothetical protein